MFGQNTISQINEAVGEFFKKMTIEGVTVESEIEEKREESGPERPHDIEGIISLRLRLQEPQVLIGQQGQTLFELQRLLRIFLNKKIGQNYYLNLDINDYKRNKIEYLENLAQSTADEVSMMKREKQLPPMNSYERRVIHAKLSGRTDISTESQGEGQDRHLIVKPK